MSKIRIEFLSWLADALDAEKAGNNVVLEQEINDGSTVKELLFLLSKKYPRFGQSVFDVKDEKLSSRVSVFHNGSPVELEKGLQTRLHDRDHLIFLPVIEGG